MNSAIGNICVYEYNTCVLLCKVKSDQIYNYVKINLHALKLCTKKLTTRKKPASLSHEYGKLGQIQPWAAA